MDEKLKIGQKRIIVIGGSAGSFQPICSILSSLPDNFKASVIMCLHRLKTTNKGFSEVLSEITGKQIIEPNDKEPIESNTIYLAPSNYHLYISKDHTFSLSTEEPINYSRPCIDVTFSSAARVFGADVTGIILSGANTDGVNGIGSIKRHKGITIAQSLADSKIVTMPKGAIENGYIDFDLSVEDLIEYLLKNHLG